MVMKMDRMLKSDKEYILTRIFAMRFVPSIKIAKITDRPRSCFLMPTKGKMMYKYNSRKIIVSPGEMLYLPRGIDYTYSFVAEDNECIQVEFDYIEKNSDETTYITFSSEPSKKNVDKAEIVKHFENIIKGYNSELYEKRALAQSSLYYLISIFSSSEKSLPSYKISKAVKYMEEHITDRLYIDDLAKMCELSQSQFRRLFKTCVGLTPLDYKNTLILCQAREMLKSSHLNISMIADNLKFADVYAFSKFFKSKTGISPTEYRKTVNIS